MGIKWRGWTANTGVKTISFILIPILVFVWISSLYSWIVKWEQNPLVDMNLLFVSFETDNYFYDMYIDSTLWEAQEILRYQDEEAIRAMKYLQWVDQNGRTYNLIDVTANAIEVEQVNQTDSYVPTDDMPESQDSEEYDDEAKMPELMEYELRSTIDGRGWGFVHDTKLTNMETAELVSMAVEDQLATLHRAQQALQSRPGLLYYVTDGANVFTNVGQPTEEYFKSHPVYAIASAGEVIEHSRQGGNAYGGMYHYYDLIRTNAKNSSKEHAIFLAFEREAVERQTAEWQQIQKEMRLQGFVIVGITLLGLLALVVNLMGAGRIRSDHGQMVHFNVFDKLYLDVSLTLLIIIEVIFIAVMAEVFSSMHRYGSESLLYWGIAVLSVGVSTPALWWLITLTKRIKDGSTIRHTLCYSVTNKLCKKVWNFCRQLWVGTTLTIKIIMITAGLFFAMLICSEMPAMSVFFTLVILVALLMWAKRLQQVVKGAQDASDGKYGRPISVKGGELGKIAGSINQISKGIHQAVEEKLKSERLKTELITNVSHDIRTPLTSIITYTDLLKSEGLDHEKAPEYLHVLIQKSQRLKTLMDELFEAAKAATGNVEVHIEELDFCALIRQCLGELDERVQASGLDFRLNLPEKAMVYGDGKLIWRVMENLISNVFKYAQPQSRVYIDVIRGVYEYKLVIKNISEAPLNVHPSELLERFKRGDSARTSEGSGLGLSIVQSFMQVQGGKFMLDIDGDLFKATVILPSVKDEESKIVQRNQQGDEQEIEEPDAKGLIERLKGSEIVQYVKKLKGQ